MGWGSPHPMKLIWGDISVFRDFHSYEELEELINLAELSPKLRPVGSPNLNLRCVGKVYNTTLSTAIRFMSNVRRDRINIFKQMSVKNEATGRYAVVVPRGISDTRTWRVYIVNVHRKVFENLGTESGAVIEYRNDVKRTGVSPYGPLAAHSIRKTMNIRVDNTGAFPKEVAVPSVCFEWTRPDSPVLLNLMLEDYREKIGVDRTVEDRDWSKILIGLGDRTQTFRWFSAELWEDMCPGLTLDLTKEDFPMDDQDFVLALMAQMSVA